MYMQRRTFPRSYAVSCSKNFRSNDPEKQSSLNGIIQSKMILFLAQIFEPEPGSGSLVEILGQSNHFPLFCFLILSN